MLQDPKWWSDEFGNDGKVLALTMKCKITLVDFGSAIALTPDDIQEGKTDIGDENQPRDLTNIPRSLDNSCSCKVLRDLSPFRSRTHYATPEVLRGTKGVNMIHSFDSSSCHRCLIRRKSIGKCTSNYGMVADAYSVGSTICHMVTGIPPDRDADEFLTSKNISINNFPRKTKSCLSRGSITTATSDRSRIYRHRNDLSLEIEEVVISMLTQIDTRCRCTVRNARNLPWIIGGDEPSPWYTFRRFKVKDLCLWLWLWWYTMPRWSILDLDLDLYS